MFNEKIIHDAKEHFKKVYPNEGVGLVIAQEFVPKENVSNTPRDSFSLSIEGSRAVSVEAVIHSHPDGLAIPSSGDMAQQMATAVPWGICVCDAEMCSDPIWFGDQVPYPPLWGEERIFRHGVTDCYSLIRHYYHATYGIWLKDFPRDWEWWSIKGHVDLYSVGFAQAGFHEIQAAHVKPGDVFLSSVGLDAMRDGKTNHGGIYLGENGDLILHHLSGAEPIDYTRPAARVPGAHYLKYVTHWLRHESRG